MSTCKYLLSNVILRKISESHSQQPNGEGGGGEAGGGDGLNCNHLTGRICHHYERVNDIVELRDKKRPAETRNLSEQP